AERRDARRDLGWNSAPQVDEVLARVELQCQRAGRKVERGGQRLQLLRASFDLLRPSPDRLDRCADREWRAEPVENASAVRRHLQIAAIARRTLLLQERVVDPLQIERSRRKQREKREEHTEQERSAQPRQLRCRYRAACAHRNHRELPSMTWMRPGPGSCIFNCSRAIFSIRAGIAHVLCSSCSWPYSTS